MKLYSMFLCDADHNTKERETQLIGVHEVPEYSPVSSCTIYRTRGEHANNNTIEAVF
jgi:hypothetical protein